MQGNTFFVLFPGCGYWVENGRLEVYQMITASCAKRAACGFVFANIQEEGVGKKLNNPQAHPNQSRAPIYEALEAFRQMRVVPFDVPGHKRGRGNPELTAFLGQQCVGVDVNSMKPLDNLCHPVSVIREAEELAADAFGAAQAFLMVGGTTSSVQSMVLATCKRGDEIILPRNVHKSVINALVLCGAVPVYVNPEVDQRLGISLGSSIKGAR